MGSDQPASPLADKTALVTGAGRGIGRAIARAYAAAGAFVYCTARTQPEIDHALAEITAAGGAGRSIAADVTDAHALGSLYERVEQERGRLDLLVVNAGVDLEPRPVEESDPAAFARTVEVNLIGAYQTVRLAIPLMRGRGGKIITIGSGTGRDGRGVGAAYACSKAALWLLTRTLANELRPYRIAVNELIPGPVDTAMTTPGGAPSPLLASSEEWAKRPEDVAPLALFLATQPEPGPSGQSFSLMRRTM